MQLADAAVKKRPLTRAEVKKQRRAEKESFARSRRADAAYAKRLKNVSRQIGSIIAAFAPKGVVKNMGALLKALDKYSDLLKPWAAAAAASMIGDVARRDSKSWAELSRTVGIELRKEIKTAPTGRAMQEILAEQVDLITSMPKKAAARVQKLTLEAMTSGKRAKETAKEIQRSTKVSQSEAMLIARTETTRAATAMTQARAEFVGSEGYIWRTAEDADVRKLHKKLNGKFIRWTHPPIAGDKGERAHAGAIYNCRCYPEPVLPE